MGINFGLKILSKKFASLPRQFLYTDVFDLSRLMLASVSHTIPAKQTKRAFKGPDVSSPFCMCACVRKVIKVFRQHFKRPSLASASVLYFSIKIQSISKNDACFLLFSVFPLLNYSKISER